MVSHKAPGNPHRPVPPVPAQGEQGSQVEVRQGARDNAHQLAVLPHPNPALLRLGQLGPSNMAILLRLGRENYSLKAKVTDLEEKVTDLEVKVTDLEEKVAELRGANQALKGVISMFVSRDGGHV